MNSLTDLLKNHIFFFFYEQKLTIVHFYRSGGRIEKPRGRGGFKRGGRGGGGRGRGRGGKKDPTPSAEDLDKELDNYLKAR